MNTFVRLELFQDVDFVRFYTVRLEVEEGEWEEDSETDKFFKEFGDTAHELNEEFNLILSLMLAIGKKTAKSYFFRHEGSAVALPSNTGNKGGVKVFANTQLRLYCIRVNDEIVILVNGGKKTEDHAQDCPIVSPYFRFANKLSEKITELIIDKELNIEGKELSGEMSFYI